MWFEINYAVDNQNKTYKEWHNWTARLENQLLVSQYVSKFKSLYESYECSNSTHCNTFIKTGILLYFI